MKLDLGESRLSITEASDIYYVRERGFRPLTTFNYIQISITLFQAKGREKIDKFAQREKCVLFLSRSSYVTKLLNGLLKC